jgi:DNA end-binding protein Ku
MPGPQWKGYLKLSLVSCPIALYPAISTAERLSFRQVNPRTGNRLRQKLVDSVTGEGVESYDKGRGYQIGENEYLVVDSHEIEHARREARTRPVNEIAVVSASGKEDRGQGAAPPDAKDAKASIPLVAAVKVPREDYSAREEAPSAETVSRPAGIRVENKRTIDIERFVPRVDMDARYYEKPYYIVPRDLVGQEAFAVIREAMRHKDVVGIGRVVIASRERLIALEPMGQGMRAVTLRYPYEVRSEAEYFSGISQIEPPGDMLRLAEKIIEMKAGEFDPATFDDRERAAVVDMLRKKHRERPRVMEVSPRGPDNVVNLMDALKRSIAVELTNVAKPVPRRLKSASAPSAKHASRRERKAS